MATLHAEHTGRDLDRDQRLEQPPRDPRRDWPPAGARHDAIESKALASWWNPPEGYAGGRDARPRIAELAEEGLTELAAFRRRSPETTHEIEEPLREYEARLRQAAEHPESRTFKGWPR